MKVTVLISDEMISEIKTLSKRKTITEALHIVMQEWISSKHLQNRNQQIKNIPIKFDTQFNAEKIRRINRRKCTPN